MPLPNIWRRSVLGEFEKLTDFSYEDFKMRLGFVPNPPGGLDHISR